MEDFAIQVIEKGGMTAVLFVAFIIAFGWCLLKIKELQRRLEDGDSRFGEVEKNLGKIDHSLGVIQGQLLMIVKSTPQHQNENL